MLRFITALSPPAGLFFVAIRLRRGDVLSKMASHAVAVMSSLAHAGK
jgi:hypothetical protein